MNPDKWSTPLGGFRYFGLALTVAGALIYLRCAWDFAFAGKGAPAPIDPRLGKRPTDRQIKLVQQCSKEKA